MSRRYAELIRMIGGAALERRLEAWARWCRAGEGARVQLGFPPHSPEQSANGGDRACGLAICKDDEAEVESVVACIALQSPLHARVLRVEYGASRDCGWSREYDTPRQDLNARRVGVGLPRYKQALREARQQVMIGLSVKRRAFLDAG